MNDNKLTKLINIVNNMNKQGTPLNEIRNNLRQTGLRNDQIDIIISKADIFPTNSEVHQAVVSVDKKISSGKYIKPLETNLKKNTKDTEKIKKNVSDMQTELRMHRKKLDEIHKKLTGGKGAGPTSGLEDKIDDLTHLIGDLKPVLKSIDSSTKKLLELNRKVLMKL
jgi:DNA-binding transcriptional MerR regulator